MTHTHSLFPNSRGADLNALVREAAIFALKEYMHLATSFNASTNPSESTDASSCVVQMHHFTAALSKVRPSVSLKVCVLTSDSCNSILNVIT